MEVGGETVGASTSNSVEENLLARNLVKCVKEEVTVKPEPEAECSVCVVCGGRCEAGEEGVGTLLGEVLRRHAPRLAPAATAPVCHACRRLLELLHQAEQDYLALKESFDAIVSRNPFYESRADIANAVKREVQTELDCIVPSADDSEDEPLAVTKKRRPRRDVKKVYPPQKKKPRAKDKVTIKHLEENTKTVGPEVKDVKKENSLGVDGSDISEINNGLHSELKLEVDDDFPNDDDDSDFLPDDFPEDKEEHMPKKGKKGPQKKDKPVYQCDQCDAKYTSLKRFELHKEKHSGGKPPYICEVCGASYKHKRACDIHVALHRGISDWKCAECDKLFPSKGALQRHNNIHTGKLNYQCDLCGKSFIHTSSFKMHKLSHSGLKPHACDVCGLALMTRSHLKRHKRVHSGEKRHECHLCGKRFSERYNLLAHAKSHESLGEAALPAAPRRRLFRCTFCQERFERRYMLERHMSTVHNRTLERSPATPRNTMSKLLKAQAQARASLPPVHSPATPHSQVSDAKEECGRAIKLQPAAGGALTVTSWSGAYVAEFNLRPDYH